MDINSIKQAIEENFPFKKDEQGNYYTDLYIEPSEELNTQDIRKIIESKDKMETFYDCLEEYVMSLQDNEYQFIVDTIKDSIDNEEIVDYIYNNIYFNFPYKHFLQQELNANITINTDKNYDYTCNNFIAYDRRVENIIQEESSILWLCKQQGYSKQQLEETVFNHENLDNKFLQSIYNECLNVTTCMNALVFTCRMTLQEYIDYSNNTNKYYITIPKYSHCGLYDSWSGGGSTLDIQLEKNVTIPSDICDIDIEGIYKYGLNEIYGGLGNQFWDCSIILREIVKNG